MQWFQIWPSRNIFQSLIFIHFYQTIELIYIYFKHQVTSNIYVMIETRFEVHIRLFGVNENHYSIRYTQVSMYSVFYELEWEREQAKI